MAFRYWCGECGFRTSWLGRSEGERQQIEHYARRHPGTPPGGHVEAGRSRDGGCGCGCGCLPLAVVALLLLVLAAACHR
ncbi:hypothetical protein ACFVVX_20065 [Kitasatospora sp. NPDC058170]|uniref:hypothetical protein n=1 Tax=Kitasatospora sp. NPDC058170 TaxID=3346364 RepID=UPI0036D8B4E1